MSVAETLHCHLQSVFPEHDVLLDNYCVFIYPLNSCLHPYAAVQIDGTQIEARITRVRVYFSLLNPESIEQLTLVLKSHLNLNRAERRLLDEGDFDESSLIFNCG